MPPPRWAVSVKGVLLWDGEVALLRNERDEWELPGGRLEQGEWPERCVEREILEELGVTATAERLIDTWVYEVLPGERVLIVTFGCSAPRPGRLVRSDEHGDARLFAVEALDGLPLPEGYRRSILAWHGTTGGPAPPVAVRPYDPATDRSWAEARLADGFGGALQARRGELIDVLALDGLVAERAGAPVGLLTWRPDRDETELAFVWAFERRTGVGSALLRAMLEAVDGPVGVTTTNDNTDALAFYQRHGFRIREVRPGAVERARTLKPQIPLVGAHGIPMVDEVELALER